MQSEASVIPIDHQLSEQCSKIVTTCNRILSMIKRSFTYRSHNTNVALYKSLIRPHWEYFVQAWRSCLKKILNCLRRSNTKQLNTIVGLENANMYEKGLDKLGLPTLEDRSMRRDMIDVFKNSK